MQVALTEIDKLLRGELLDSDDPESTWISLRMRILVVVGLVLGVVYGLCMGFYGVVNRGWEGVWQLMASAVKVPLLFILTLIVTFPSLYVFSALLRSRLRLEQTLKLLIAAIAVNLTVLASLGPVVALFTLSTRSHSFMVLLNVMVFAVAGIIGLGFLVRMLRRVFAAAEQVPSPRTKPADNARWVFRIWLLIFAVVGAQMGWILRPFVGNPDLPFEFVRDQWSNFFAAVVAMLSDLFG